MKLATKHHPSTARTDWRGRAVCRDEDPDLFFETGNGGPALLQIAEAKTVCRRCPAQEACLKWALDNPRDAEHGTWGGKSSDERRAIIRKGRR